MSTNPLDLSKYSETGGAGLTAAQVDQNWTDLESAVNLPFGNEVSVTAALVMDATAFGKIHSCSGTTTNYQVTLPPVSGNGGKYIWFRMAAALTKLVTIKANAAELIDGQNTRIMWSQETALLMCTGASWVKLAGKSRAMTCAAYPTAALSVASSTQTKVPMDVFIDDNTGLMADSVNKRIAILRPSNWSVDVSMYWNTGTQIMTTCQVNVRKSNAYFANNIIIQQMDVPAAEFHQLKGTVPVLNFGPGDITPFVFHANGAAAARSLFVNDVNFTIITVEERPTW